MRLLLILPLFLLFPVRALADNASDSIRSALMRQRDAYPASHYRDVYKNFMQDYFGPGHILADTVAAADYVRHELASTSHFGGPDYEPTGYEGNFCRVNLRLVHDGIVPYSVFFSSFVRSVQGIVPPSPELWRKKWSQIDNELQASGWHFDDEQADRSEIGRRLSSGDFIVHHSRAFNEATDFHYRIISRQLFETEILPFIKNKTDNHVTH